MSPSEEPTPEERQAVLDEFERLMEAADNLVRKNEKVKAAIDARHKADIQKHAPKIDQRTAQAEALVSRMAELWVANESWLTKRSKTLELRFGKLSARMSEAVEILDKKLLEKLLRKAGRWLASTTQPKREISKTKLKPVLIEIGKVNPELAEMLAQAAEVVTGDQLKATFRHSKLEAPRALDPLRRRLGSPPSPTN